MAYLTDLSFGPDTRVVLIGTTVSEDDADMLPPLPHANANVDHLARLLTDPDICGLDPSCIVRLVDTPTASEVVDQVWKAAGDATDTLLVYYAGHGLYGDAEVPIYLAATKTTDRGKAFNGISINLIKKAMKGSRARKRILILDCCYSGRALEGGMAAADDAATVLPAIDLAGTFGIAAVPANAKALAPPDQKLTAFTGALVEVLEQGLRIDERVLKIEDVFDEVERKIGRDARAPLPKTSNFDKGEKFLIARNRYVRQGDINELAKAVYGLRDTVASTGARLEALEARKPDQGNVPERLAAIEAKLAAPKEPAQSSGFQEIYDRLQLTKEQWDRLPMTDRLYVRHYFRARIVTLSWLATISFASAGLVGWVFSSHVPIQTPYFAAALFLVGVLPAGAAIKKVSSRQTGIVMASASSPDSDDRSWNNDLLMDVLVRPMIEILGVRLTPGYTMLAGFVALCGSLVALMPLYLR